MNQADFDRFGTLWRQEPADEEARLLRRLARRAGRRGRALQHVELGVALLSAGGAAAALWWQPAPPMAVIVGLILGAVSWSSWRRYRLGRTAMMLDRGDRETLLATAERSARARLRRSTIGLALLLPGWMLGVSLKAMLVLDGDFGRFIDLLLPSFMGAGAIMAAALVLLLLACFGRANMRLRRELKQIERLRAEYRVEALLDRRAAGSVSAGP